MFSAVNALLLYPVQYALFEYKLSGDLPRDQMQFQVFIHRAYPKFVLLQAQDLIGLVSCIILKVQSEVFLAVLQGPSSIGLELKAQIPQRVKSRKRGVAIAQHLQLVLVEGRGHIVLACVQGLPYPPSVGNALFFGPQAESRPIFILLAAGAQHRCRKSNYEGPLNVYHVHSFWEWVVK